MKGTTSLKYTLMKCAESVRKKGKRVDAIVCCTWTRYLGSTKHPINPTTYVQDHSACFSSQKSSIGNVQRSLKFKLCVSWHEGGHWCAHMNGELRNIGGHCLDSHAALPGNTWRIGKLLNNLSFPLPLAKLKSKRSVVKRSIQLLFKNPYK